ncbi:TPA: hypothetical protein HA241_02685 [Candidatus Woesearchaeota archaeon]|nr:hypothetical protein [Candidatus Woesearchaeota archaeon]
MPTLLALLSTGKGTWSEVNKIMQSQPWTHVFLITNRFGEENFTSRSEQTSLVVIDFSLETMAVIKEIKKKLQGKIQDFEVALNLASGTGKEHMAVLEAVLELGLNFRLVTVKDNQAYSLGIER